MKKYVVVAAAIIVAAGGYVHYNYWQSQSNKIRDHIQHLADGTQHPFKLTYDALEVGGYPFKHEITLKNPCLYHLNEGDDFSLNLSEICHEGTLHLNYTPFSWNKSLSVQSEGKLLLTLPGEENDSLTKLIVDGKLNQNYLFDEAYQFHRTTEVIYFLEHLRRADLSASHVTVSSAETPAKEYFKDLSSSLSYSRSDENQKEQDIRFSVDYSTFVGEPMMFYQHPFGSWMEPLSEQLHAFGVESGLNTGTSNIVLKAPSWNVLKETYSKLVNASFNLDDIPNISLQATHTSNNNFLGGEGELGVEWSEKQGDRVNLKAHSRSAQKLSPSGKLKLSRLLETITAEWIGSLTAEPSGEIKKSSTHIDLDELYQGMPSQWDWDIQFAVSKSLDTAPKSTMSVSLDPFQIATDKGVVTLNLDYESDKPFMGTLKVDSFVRVVDGIITRYNVLASALPNKLPRITEKERDHLLAIFQKYSDDPEKLSKTVTFSVTEAADGTLVVGKQQDIRGLVGELAFYFQHLKEKVHQK